MGSNTQEETRSSSYRGGSVLQLDLPQYGRSFPMLMTSKGSNGVFDAYHLQYFSNYIPNLIILKPRNLSGIEQNLMLTSSCNFR